MNWQHLLALDGRLPLLYIVRADEFNRLLDDFARRCLENVSPG